MSSPRPGFSPPRAGGGASHARGLAASVGQASADLFLPSRRSRGQDRAFHLPTRSAPRRWASLRMRRHQQPAAMKTVSPRGPPRSFGIVGSVGSVRSTVSPDGGSDAPLPGSSPRRPTPADTPRERRGWAEAMFSPQGQPRGQPRRRNMVSGRISSFSSFATGIAVNGPGRRAPGQRTPAEKDEELSVGFFGRPSAKPLRRKSNRRNSRECMRFASTGPPPERVSEFPGGAPGFGSRHTSRTRPLLVRFDPAGWGREIP